MDIKEKIADLQHDQRIRRGNENYLLLAPCRIEGHCLRTN